MFMKPTQTLRRVGFLGRRARWLGCVVLLLVGGACAMTARQADVKMKEVQHPNGLTVRVPESFVVEVYGDQLYVTPPSSEKKHREGKGMKIKLHVGKSLPPEAKDAEVRRFGDRSVFYRYREEDGGSGGTAYVANGWEETSNGYIYYDYVEQSGEFSRPDYSFGWQVIQGTSVKQ